MGLVLSVQTDPINEICAFPCLQCVNDKGCCGPYPCAATVSSYFGQGHHAHADQHICWHLHMRGVLELCLHYIKCDHVGMMS